MRSVIKGMVCVWGVSATLLAAAPAYPVFSYGELLGGVSDGTYLGLEEAYTRFKGEKSAGSYRLYGKKGAENAFFTLQKIVREKDMDEITRYSVKGEGAHVDALALPESFPFSPRNAKLLNIRDAKSKAYEKALVRLLRDKGITETNVTIQESYSIDMDGDGEKEKLLLISESKNLPLPSYENYNARYADFGDYVALVLLKKQGDGYVPLVITGEFYTHDTEAISRHDLAKYTLKAVVDINGDGMMEIMLYKKYWSDGGNVVIYDITSGKAKNVFGSK